MAGHPNAIAGLAPTMWKPGVSGNPGGRPVGTQLKINKKFLNDLLKVYEVKGKKAIEDMCDKDPSAFVRVLASLLPKEMNLNIKENPFDGLSVEQYDRLISIAEGKIGILEDGQRATVIEGELSSVHSEDID